MEDDIQLMLDVLRCVICKNYLSSPPIWLLPDGTNVCANCKIEPRKGPAYRQFTLEAILSKVSFGCKFEKNGCKERLKFSKTKAHEDVCDFRSFRCPFNLDEDSCDWSGGVSNMAAHFSEKHKELSRLNEVKIVLDLLKDNCGISIVTVGEVTFVVKHNFNHLTSTVRYDIRYLNSEVEKAQSRIKISNFQDEGCGMTLKKNDLTFFSENFYGWDDAQVLALESYLKILEVPESIAIAIDFFVVKLKTVKYEVDYKVLETLRCKRCNNYLIAPLYENTLGIICCFCKKSNKDQPSKNQNLLDLVRESAYPCRWRNCNVVRKSYDISEHERVCPFRMYDCTMCNNFNFFKIDDVKFHLENIHKCCYFTDVYTCEIFFKETETTVFTIKNNEIVFYYYNLYNHNNSSYAYNPSLQMIQFRINSTSENNKISARVHFEHQHCKIRSKTFSVTDKSSFTVSKKDFPSCFDWSQNLQMTVHIS